MIGEFKGRKSGTGPGVAAKVEGILVTLSFVFVFEAVVTVLANILLFHLVNSGASLVTVEKTELGHQCLIRTGGRPHSRTS